MESKLTYITAIPEDHELLTEIAMQSKKMWGYSDELMNLWKPDLEVTAEYISENKVVKVFDENKFIGFFGLKMIPATGVVIDHLWLIPGEIKKGYGRIIFQHIIHHLKMDGHKKVTLIAEPNATGFYDKMNGRITGKFQSKVSGRFLDIYEFDLTQ
jgi:hypothetical protein